MASVHDHVVVESQHGRQPFARVIDVGVAALAQRVPEENGALGEIDGVAVRAEPRVEWLCRPRASGFGMFLVRTLDTCGVLLLCDLQPFLEQQRNFARDLVAVSGLSGSIHGRITWLAAMRQRGGIDASSAGKRRVFASRVDSMVGPGSRTDNWT